MNAYFGLLTFLRQYPHDFFLSYSNGVPFVSLARQPPTRHARSRSLGHSARSDS